MFRTGNKVALIGRYYHALEQKGRLSIPKSYRGHLGNPLVVSRGLEGCLFCFPTSEWETLATKLATLPLTQKAARDWLRLLAQSATEVTVDPLGRILIPEYLRRSANLKKKIVIAGSINRVEIWDEATYHHYLDELHKNETQISESLNQL